MYHIFFIHSSTEGRSGCFHVSATVNNAAMNIGVHVCVHIHRDIYLYIYIFKNKSLQIFRWILRRIGRSYGNSILNFLRNLHAVLMTQMAVSIYNTFPLEVYEGSFFSTTSPSLVTSCLVDNSHSNRYEVVPYCGFDMHFPNS